VDPADLPPASEVQRHITVSAAPSAGVIHIIARARTASAAVALADGVAQETAAVAGRLAPDGVGTARLVVGDFEQGLDGWLAPSLFNASPASLRLTHSIVRFNRTALEAACRPVLGCGPSVRIEYPFQAGIQYTATLWVRVRPVGAPVAGVFGSKPTDVSGTPRFHGGAGWGRLVVSWTPKSASPIAAVGIQTRRRIPTRIWVDGALVFDPRAAGPGAKAVPTPGEESRILANARYVTVSSAKPLASAGGDTAKWALIGAAVGLAVALSATGAGWLAERRRESNPN